MISGPAQAVSCLQQEELAISRGETPKLFALRFKDPGLVKDYMQKDK